ncbi:hypothetical protein D9M70_519910 [compost metagenome]
MVDPALHGLADGDAAQVVGQAVELAGIGTAGDHMADPAALQAVAQVIGGEQGGGRDQHGAELEGGKHDVPQRHLVAQHQQDALAALHAQLAQVVGHAVGTAGQLLEAEALFAALVADYPERRGIVTPGHDIEVVQRPVERTELRPFEVAYRGVVVGTVGQQEVSGSYEGVRGVAHARLSFVVVWRLRPGSGQGVFERV